VFFLQKESTEKLKKNPKPKNNSLPDPYALLAVRKDDEKLGK